MARPMPELAGVRHSRVQAGDVKLHLAEAGSGDPVVLLHGWPQHWWVWRHLIPPLAERHRVLAFDLRGFGWSDAPAGGYDKRQAADDVLAALDTLGIDGFGLVGHDWGGYAGFLMCLERPSRVERFLALNTGHPWTRPSLAVAANFWRLGYQLALATPLLGEEVVRDGRVVRLVARIGGEHGSWTKADLDTFASQFSEPARVRATQLTYRTFITRELPAAALRRDAGHTDVPILFLHGTEDPVVKPSMLAGFERQAPNMRLELVPGVSHFIADEAPELVRERALEFFGARA